MRVRLPFECLVVDPPETDTRVPRGARRKHLGLVLRRNDYPGIAITKHDDAVVLLQEFKVVSKRTAVISGFAVIVASVKHTDETAQAGKSLHRQHFCSLS